MRLMISALVLATAGTAFADDFVLEDRPLYAWRDPTVASGFGVGVQLGGGATGFSGRTMRDSVSGDVGGMWDVRVTLGTHLPLAVELSYLGEADNITAIGAPNGTLIGTTAEGDLRWNLTPHYLFTPYVFAGVGYQRYDVQNVQFASADIGMRPSDNAVEFPMGVGASWRDPSGFSVDLRGTYRAVVDSNLVVNDSGTGYANMSWWEASASFGYEF
jgi:hypothetical protein